MKILVPGSAVGLDAFADFYRFPVARVDPAPLLIWVGGAIDFETYDERRATEPLALLAELDSARARLGNPPVDALLLSAPPTLQEAEERHVRFRRLLASELLPRLPHPEPTGLGLVGNSFGAHLATAFACRRDDVRVLVTLAGVGLWEAVDEAGGELPAHLFLRCYANDQDFATVYAIELQVELQSRGRHLDLVERPGDHPFADYARNGSVAEAFEFALIALRDRV